jgi:hypothetical protein
MMHGIQKLDQSVGREHFNPEFGKVCLDDVPSRLKFRSSLSLKHGKSAM